MTLLRLGDDVRLPDGREGQVWIEPAAHDLAVIVAVGTAFVTPRIDDLQVVNRQLPEPKDTLHTARLVRARKAHTCARCSREVKPGKSYVRSVIFPGHSSGFAGVRGEPGAAPVHQDLCVLCAAKFDDTHPTAIQQKEAS